jgi:Ca2+-binding EF-hand superfamily protein
LEEASVFDTDSNNLIDASEFENVYTYHFSQTANNYHRDYLFALYDADNDQSLSLQEYS